MDTISRERELVFQLLRLYASNNAVAAEAMQLTEPERGSLDVRGFDFSSRQTARLGKTLSDQSQDLDGIPEAPPLAKLVKIYQRVSVLGESDLVREINQRLVEIYGVDEATKPYNQPNVMLYDMRFWAKISSYSAQEAALLCCGRDPSPELCEYLDALYPAEFTTTRFLADYFNRVSLLKSAMDSGALSDQSNAMQVVTWCHNMGFPFPVELVEIIQKYQGGLVFDGTNFTEELGKKERSSLLRLVAAMALEQYSYDPRASRSPVLSDILHDLDTAGLSMDRKTVSKWLREAVDLVPQEYWQDR